MRANPCLCCLLLGLGVATPLLPIPVAQAQQPLADPANDMAAPSDDDEEHGVGDKPERDGRLVTVEAGRGRTYGAVRRGDGYDPDADDGGRAGTPHPLQLANPDHDIASARPAATGRAAPSSTCDGSGPRRRRDAGNARVVGLAPVS